MPKSFAQLKKDRKSSIDKLSKTIESMNSNVNVDERFWYPEVDKSGIGYAVIRFLPAPQGEDDPFVRRFQHGFKAEDGKWFIEECPTTIGNDCPVCTENSRLWNTEIESNKNIARDRKRKLQYISNIMVVKDPANPQNEGKVFLYRYGKMIWNKLQNAMFPEFEDAARWQSTGVNRLWRELAHQINPDGMSYEASIPYHRLVTEMALSVGALGVAFAPVIAYHAARPWEDAGAE